MIDAAKRASADYITAVIPYFGYARQDRKDKPRVPISSKLIANLLVAAGVDRVITMDLHATQIQGYFNIPVDHLLGLPIIAEYFKKKDMKDVVIVAPDHGSVKKARNLAERMNCPIAIIHRHRKIYLYCFMAPALIVAIYML